MQNFYRTFLVLFIVLFSGCTYSLTIKSVPTGAEIVDLSRGYIGKTDTTIQTKSGESYNLTFKKEGYSEEKRNVPNISSSRTVMVELTRAQTYLTVKSEPAGAKIIIYDPNGTVVPLKTFSKTGLKETYANRKYVIPNHLKKVMIELDQEGFDILRRELVIEPFHENNFIFQLERRSPHIVIKSIPSNVEVYEKNLGFLGITPLDVQFPWDKLTALSQVNKKYTVEKVNLHLRFHKTGYEDLHVVETVNLDRACPRNGHLKFPGKDSL